MITLYLKIPQIYRMELVKENGHTSGPNPVFGGAWPRQRTVAGHILGPQDYSNAEKDNLCTKIYFQHRSDANAFYERLRSDNIESSFTPYQVAQN